MATPTPKINARLTDKSDKLVYGEGEGDFIAGKYSKEITDNEITKNAVKSGRLVKVSASVVIADAQLAASGSTAIEDAKTARAATDTTFTTALNTYYHL